MSALESENAHLQQELIAAQRQLQEVQLEKQQQHQQQQQDQQQQLEAINNEQQKEYEGRSNRDFSAIARRRESDRKKNVERKEKKAKPLRNGIQDEVSLFISFFFHHFLSACCLFHFSSICLGGCFGSQLVYPLFRSKSKLAKINYLHCWENKIKLLKINHDSKLVVANSRRSVMHYYEKKSLEKLILRYGRETDRTNMFRVTFSLFPCCKTDGQLNGEADGEEEGEAEKSCLCILSFVDSAFCLAYHSLFVSISASHSSFLLFPFL